MDKFDKVSFLLPIGEIESGALDQIEELNKIPFIKSIAICPDVHKGYLVPVGGVILTDGMLSPEAIGPDAGCGMLFFDTGVSSEGMQDKKFLEHVSEEIYKAIPVGKTRFDTLGMGDFTSALGDRKFDDAVRANQVKQLGTLGGGNHFIEIGVTESDTIGITVHSGSRNLGKQLFDFYNLQGTWFHHKSEIGKAYLQDLAFMTDWALANRRKMLFRVLEILGITPHTETWQFNIINKNHNFLEITKDGLIIRKGATSANYGEMGVIPLNMKDGTYIVRGLGNPIYLNSCSHGAGRQMSRNQAKKSLSMDDFRKEMLEAGIVAKVDESTLDESSKAYKDGDRGIGYQEGIVIEVVDYIRPILNVKG